jgi:hypothetical protein
MASEVLRIVAARRFEASWPAAFPAAARSSGTREHRGAEFAHDADASNPSDGTREPFPAS